MRKRPAFASGPIVDLLLNLGLSVALALALGLALAAALLGGSREFMYLHF